MRTIVIVLAAGLAGCGSAEKLAADPSELANATEHIGRTYRLPVNIQTLCKRPDFPINQRDEDCPFSSDGGSTTVVGVAENHGDVFIKVRIANGLEGYDMASKLRYFDTEIQPRPRIGMTETEAESTNWGDPETRNLTDTAGHHFEQWVFPAFGYLYIRDGVLTTIQRRLGDP